MQTPCHDEGGGGGGGGAAASTGRTVAVDTTDGRFMCPACRRTLAHQPAALLSKCGHVLCDACVEQFVVPGKARAPRARECVVRVLRPFSVRFWLFHWAWHLCLYVYFYLRMIELVVVLYLLVVYVR